jgi:ABC-type Fe3+-hydroxamate transport system substrate-binding protein
MNRMKKYLVVVVGVIATVTALQPTTAAAKYPSRIISLSPSATEDLFAIGAGKQVVAVDSLSNFPANAPMTKLDAFTPNVEAIAKYKPDLVILQSSATKAQSVKSALESLKIKVYFEVTPSDLAGAYSEIAALGEATGKASQATKLIASMKAAIKTAIAKGRKSSPLPIFHEVDNTLYSATSKTFIGHVYADFNTRNIADAADTADSYGYPQLTNEYLLKANPSVIFLSDGEKIASAAARAGWSSIDAVAKNHIVVLPDDIPSRWGPRLVNFYQFVSTTLAAIK